MKTAVLLRSRPEWRFALWPGTRKDGCFRRLDSIYSCKCEIWLRNFSQKPSNQRNYNQLLVDAYKCLFQQATKVVKVGTHEGTGPCNKLRRQVPLSELVILPQNIVPGTKIWSRRLVPRIQTGLNFWYKSLRLIPQNALCELFVG